MNRHGRSETRRLPGLLVAAGLAAVAAPLIIASGALATRTAARMATPVIVSTKTLPKLGTVLVNGSGYTLYMFEPDKHAKVTCLGPCAVAWPPLKLPAGAKPVAKGSAKASLLGSDPDKSGFKVVTYKGWPLYRWAGDIKPGEATGQAVNANGGLWYVLSASGTVITTKSSSATSKPTAPSSGVAAGAAEGCPKGETIWQASPSGDNDADNSAGGADDHDGCL